MERVRTVILRDYPRNIPAENLEQVAALETRAEQYYNAREFEKAEATFREIALLAPDDGRAYFNIGMLHYEQKVQKMVVEHIARCFYRAYQCGIRDAWEFCVKMQVRCVQKMVQAGHVIPEIYAYIHNNYALLGEPYEKSKHFTNQTMRGAAEEYKRTGDEEAAYEMYFAAAVYGNDAIAQNELGNLYVQKSDKTDKSKLSMDDFRYDKDACKAAYWYARADANGIGEAGNLCEKILRSFNLDTELSDAANLISAWCEDKNSSIPTEKIWAEYWTFIAEKSRYVSYSDYQKMKNADGKDE